jgi:hypothetical protein
MDNEQEIAPTLSQAQFLRIALDALSRRAARWLAMGMAFALFSAAVWKPHWGRLAAAAAFTLLVHFPLWIRGDTR